MMPVINSDNRSYLARGNSNYIAEGLILGILAKRADAADLKKAEDA